MNLSLRTSVALACDEQRAFDLIASGRLFALTGATDVACQFVEGGEFALSFGDRGRISGQFSQISRAADVALSWHVTGFGRPDERSHVAFKIGRDGARTRLTVSHQAIISQRSLAAKTAAWRSILADLGRPYVRKATMPDRAGIHAAHMRSIREICVKQHGDEIRGWGYRELGERWISGIANGLVWVVDLCGQVEGCGAFVIDGSHAHIQAVYLTPAVVGGGLGAEMLMTMLNDIAARGLREVTLDSTLTGLGFYRKFGFQPVGPATQSPIGGHPVTSIPMARTL